MLIQDGYDLACRFRLPVLVIVLSDNMGIVYMVAVQYQDSGVIVYKIIQLSGTQNESTGHFPRV